MPVIDEEVGPKAAHVAGNAEILEYLASETTVGVLVVGSIADVGDDDEEDGDVVEEYFGEAVVVFVPAEFEGEEVCYKVGKEETADGGDAEDDVAPYDAEPFAEVGDVEDACVGEVEEYLGGQEEEKG